MKNYYDILEIGSDATQDNIKDQYRFLIQAWHPDKFSNPDQKKRAEEKTKQINKAYSVLSSPEKRKKYDVEQRNEAAKSQPSPSGSTSSASASSQSSKPPAQSYSESPRYHHNTGAGSRCQICGAEAETKKVTFHENIGMLIARKHGKTEGKLCKNCINYQFWTRTGRTALLGWWGMISFFATILILINNLFVFLGTLGMSKGRRSLIDQPSPGWVLSTVAGYLVIGYLLFFIFTPAMPSSPASTNSSSSSSSSYSAPSPTRTPRPRPTSTQANPLPGKHWRDITASDVGKKILVHGHVFFVDYRENETRIEFSVTPNTFFMTSSIPFEGMYQGMCVFSEGVIKMWGGKIPYMEVVDLYTCDDW